MDGVYVMVALKEQSQADGSKQVCTFYAALVFVLGVNYAFTEKEFKYMQKSP